MNDTLIQSFLTIVSEGSFNRAAEKIYISQPNLSRNIARLERELNTKLFDRTGKRAILTEQGRIYLSAFQKMEKCLADAKEQADMLSTAQQGLIRIGYVNGWDISNFIQPVLKRMKTDYPGIRVSLEAYGLQELSAKFNFGQLDLILTLQERAEKIYDAQSAVIDIVPRVILFSKNLFRADRCNWEPGDFRDETFFILNDGRENMQEEYVRGIGMKYGFSPNICIVNNMESVLMNVENGLGVTICDSWMRNVHAEGFLCCELEHMVQISAAWKAPDEKSVLNILLKIMKENSKNRRKITA